MKQIVDYSLALAGGMAATSGGSLHPDLAGCPECRTGRLIASPEPLGTCDRCGGTIVQLTASQIGRLRRR